MLSQTQLKRYLEDGSIVTLILDHHDAQKELLNNEFEEKMRYKTDGSTLSIEMKKVTQLNGDIEPIITNVGDGSIITLFDKTPFPKQNDDVVCPHFIELKWANGCNFDCAWCYLNGTLRFRPMKKKPYAKDTDKVKSHLLNYFNQVTTPTLLNSGELSDSLAFEGHDEALTKQIIPLFKEQDVHKLLILTKSSNINGILRSNSQESVIVSFSVNAFDVSKTWEKKAPSTENRIKAAKKLHDAGYQIRIRIDPIVPVEGWEHKYRQLIDYLMSTFRPERITIGSLRGLQSTINHSEDRSWVDYLDDKSNWGKKISFDKRYQMYKIIIDYLNEKYNFSKIGICKETVEMWKKLEMDFKKIECNCIL